LLVQVIWIPGYMRRCSYIHMSDDHAIADAAGCESLHLPVPDAESRRSSLLGPRTVEALAETFRVLGDPTRVRILDALEGGELCVCDIASLVGISESAASHQLRLLRGMRLVRPRREGRVVFYSLDDQHIISIFKQTLQHVEEFSSSRRAASEPAPGARVRRPKVARG
jgi:ArsR family transcriptional regulator, lead/cadmium/zinc/bismuth-responsive transcriptional repressor